MLSRLLSRKYSCVLTILVAAVMLMGAPLKVLAVVAADVPVVDGGDPWNDDEEYIVAETSGWQNNEGNPWDDDEYYVSAPALPTMDSGNPWNTDEDYLLLGGNIQIFGFAISSLLLTYH